MGRLPDFCYFYLGILVAIGAVFGGYTYYQEYGEVDWIIIFFFFLGVCSSLGGYNDVKERKKRKMERMAATVARRNSGSNNFYGGSSQRMSYTIQPQQNNLVNRTYQKPINNVR